MTQEKDEKEKIPSRKGILAWVRDILQPAAPEIGSLPREPSQEVVTSLISKATGGSLHSGDREADEGDGKDGSGGDDGSGGKGKESCPYAVKRNIVESLREIRRFAEEHQLAASVVKALLSMLAEIALGALKGKVSGAVLDTLLKIFSYERKIEEYRLREQLAVEEAYANGQLAAEEAYRRGELAGRNAAIREEFFPAQSGEVPALRGGGIEEPPAPDFFSMARDA